MYAIRSYYVAALMRERNISSVVVCEGALPVGIVTDRDLRNKVVSRGLDSYNFV